MKKPVRSLLIIILMGLMPIGLFTFSSQDMSYSPDNTSGPPAGYCGDPASQNRDCSGCHPGSDVQTRQGWITADIPEGGYEAGITYTITATASGEGLSKFGFQVSSQNSNGDFLGILVNTGSETKLTPGNNYITHTTSGTAGQNSKDWTFEWTAPGAGSGEVIFYGAFNLTNNNGSTSGDNIVLSTLTVNEGASSGFRAPEITGQVSVYPNPAMDYLTVEIAEELAGSRFVIYDQAGRRVMAGILSGNSNTVSIGHLEAGIYHIRVIGSKAEAIKFVKK